MGIGNGILVNFKQMNNLLQIREKIKKDRRLNQAKILATINGQFTPYKRSVFQERIRESQKNFFKQDS